jgi:hypothetical protein
MANIEDREQYASSVESEIKTGARMRMNTAFCSKPTSPLARRLNFLDTPPLAGFSWVNHLIPKEMTEFC